jgi:cobalt-zinc-cadmium efflux system outer membrane protein
MTNFFRHSFIRSAVLILLLLAAGNVSRADENVDSRNLPASAAIEEVSVRQSANDTEPILPGQLLEAAYERNPSILSARAEWRATAAMYPQATSWPDPNLNVSWFPQPVETRNGSSDFTIQLMQMIPNPGRLDLMGERALTMSEMKRVEFERTVRNVLADVLVSYFELGYLHRAVEIAETNRDLFAQLAELARLQYGQNEIPASEMYSAESSLAQAEYELQLLDELIQSEESNMRSQIGMSPDEPVGTAMLADAPAIEIDLEEIRSLALEYRQELEMAGIAVEAAEINVSIARSRRNPDFSVGLMYNSIGTSPLADGTRTSGDDAFGIMFGMTIPIWDDALRARVEQAESELEAAQADRENMTNMAIAAADRLYWQLQNQSRLVTLYSDTLLPQAVEAASLAQTWYDEEQISFSQLVESRMVVENFELAEARARADYLESLVELQRLVGAQVIDWNEEVSG